MVGAGQPQSKIHKTAKASTCKLNFIAVTNNSAKLMKIERKKDKRDEKQKIIPKIQ